MRTLSLHKISGERSLLERGGVWGTEEQELGTHGREERSLLRHWEAGMSDSSQLFLRGVPPVEKLLGGLASKSLQRGRIGAGQRRGQWGTKGLEWAW